LIGRSDCSTHQTDRNRKIAPPAPVEETLKYLF
jgi:hypothetical protein